jgi:hypothetical protein
VKLSSVREVEAILRAIAKARRALSALDKSWCINLDNIPSSATGASAQALIYGSAVATRILRQLLEQMSLGGEYSAVPEIERVVERQQTPKITSLPSSSLCRKFPYFPRALPIHVCQRRSCVIEIGPEGGWVEFDERSYRVLLNLGDSSTYLYQFGVCRWVFSPPRHDHCALEAKFIRKNNIEDWQTIARTTQVKTHCVCLQFIIEANYILSTAFQKRLRHHTFLLAEERGRD